MTDEELRLRILTYLMKKIRLMSADQASGIATDIVNMVNGVKETEIEKILNKEQNKELKNG